MLMQLKKIRLCIIGMALLAGSVYAQKRVSPSISISNSSFAIFVDKGTFNQCRKEIEEYKKVLEDSHLPTFIFYGDWKNPEHVKKEIVELYKKKKLEGMVFIGDIPIAMVQKAQHMTSAFKMDESKPRIESSVPSDRFYDDLHLKFDYISHDSAKNQFFYYNLSADSPQRIQCELYSGRIKPINNGVDKYEQIKKYLRKVVKEHRSENKLNQFVSYSGEGSFSNSLSAWTPEIFNISEQFPGVFEEQGCARFLRYSMNDFPKEELLNQIRRNDLDLMIFHEHGMPERQYISAEANTNEFDDHIASMKAALRDRQRLSIKNGKSPSKLYTEYETKYHLDSVWFKGYNNPKMIEKDSLTDIHRGIVLGDITKAVPNVRFVIFDACYNGDFREDDYIAGRYIFSDGKCVSTFANSVNVLQDKSADDLLGLLGLGARIGQWARYTNILESHIIGDPTFRFTSNSSSIDAAQLINKNYNEAEQLKLLHTSSLADIQNLALYNLYRNNYKGISALLLKTFESSPFATVRYSCMHLLEKINDNNFYEVLKQGSSDSYEFIRRIAVTRMGSIGLPEFLPFIIKLYINDDHSERVVFNVKMALRLYPEADVKRIADSCFNQSYYINKGQEMKNLLSLSSSSLIKELNQVVADKKAKESNRLFYISVLKNINYHPGISLYVSLLKDSSENIKIRTAMLDALSWFSLSYNKGLIIDACKDLIKDSSTPKILKKEALRTYNRLMN